jgi:hypothetical protein
MAKSVLCTANSDRQVLAIVTDLRAAGFASEDISVLFSDKTARFRA